MSRYYRSLDLLIDAKKFRNRAYLFDNSGSGLLWLAEIIDGRNVELKSQNRSVWFEKYVLGKKKTAAEPENHEMFDGS